MDILITTPTYPPFNSGLGNAVQNQAKILSSLGHKVTIATAGTSGLTRYDANAEATIVEFSVTGSDNLFNPIKGDTGEYVNFLTTSDFDLILLNSWQIWSTDIALQNLTQISAKVVLYSHCISTNSFLGRSWLRAMVRYLAWRPYWFRVPRTMRNLDGMIFLSECGCDERFDDLELAIKLGIAYWIIPNAIPQYAEHSLSIKSNKKDRTQIISVGSYDWFKGHDFAIRAYAQSEAKNVFPLKIFGQRFNAYTDSLRKLAAELGIAVEFIVFSEGVSSNILISEYLKSLIFIGGSPSECQPLVILDSMAAGAPFVARRSGCIQSLPGGFAVNDCTEAAARINELIHSDDKWLNMSNKGREYIIQEHAPKGIKNLFVDFLGSLQASP